MNYETDLALFNRRLNILNGNLTKELGITKDILEKIIHAETLKEAQALAFSALNQRVKPNVVNSLHEKAEEPENKLPANSALDPSLDRSEPPRVKRRGRPPGSKNKIKW